MKITYCKSLFGVEKFWMERVPCVPFLGLGLIGSFWGFRSLEVSAGFQGTQKPKNPKTQKPRKPETRNQKPGTRNPENTPASALPYTFTHKHLYTFTPLHSFTSSTGKPPLRSSGWTGRCSCRKGCGLLRARFRPRQPGGNRLFLRCGAIWRRNLRTPECRRRC